MDKIKANKTENRKGAGRPKIIVDIENTFNNIKEQIALEKWE